MNQQIVLFLAYPDRLFNKLLYENRERILLQITAMVCPLIPQLIKPLSPIVIVSYIKELSGKLNQILEDFVINKTAYYSIIKISNAFSHIKDKIPTMLRSAMVYCIRCNDCEGVKTKRQLIIRIEKHKRNVRSLKK